MHTFTRATARLRITRRAVLMLAGLILVTATPVLADWEADDSFINSRTPGERANLYGFEQSPDFEREYAERLRTFDLKLDLPDHFSWVTQGGLTIAKDQGSCGSCWDFAGIGQIEAHMKIFYNKEMDLSEQQILNCNTYGSDCDGGWASAVYSIAMTYGVTREAATPYGGTSSMPCTQGDYLPFAFVDNWYYVSSNIDQIKMALQNGPVCSTMDADDPFPSYTGGCYDEPGGPSTNHLILIVGWDDRACDGVGAWICKNSWGLDFGYGGGLFNIAYDASLIGTNVTQIELVVPTVGVVLQGPDPEIDYYADETMEIEWDTSGGTCDFVDIWIGEQGVFDTLIADGTPNDGSFAWTIANFDTDKMRICIVADGDTRNGFDISDAYTVIGHKTVYVSALGSDTPPYTTPSSAAHVISDAVTACSGRDTILVAAGDYFETVGISGSVWVIGGWDDSFTTRDSRANPTRIQSGQSGMVFILSPAGHSGVIGVEFHDCIGLTGSMPSQGRHGGGVYCNAASPLIKDCVFTDNSADPYGGFGVGGAIAAIGGSPRIEGCVFTGSLAVQGGAVALIDPVAVEIVDSEFLVNTCPVNTTGQAGAALYVSGGSVVLSGNRFEGNGTTVDGGAIYAQDATLTLTDNDFIGNQAQNKGGAIAVQGGSISLQGGEVSGNSSTTTSGGGLHVSTADIVMRNVLVSGNTGPSFGAGLFMTQIGTAELENCVITGNVAPTTYMGAACILGCEILLFRNNIVADNQGGGANFGGVGMNVDYNILWNNGTDLPGWTPGPHDIIAQPLFVDAAGGDHGLALHSPGLDRSDPDVACNDTDGSRGDMGTCGGPLALTSAPAFVQGAQLTDLGDGRLEVSWDPNTEPDVSRYVVYNSTDDPFVPAPELVVADVLHPIQSWIDETPSGGYYLVVAVDAEGHVGGYSEQVGGTTPVAGDPTPKALAVARIAPNPFNPRTTVAYDVPRSGPISVRIHDMRGRVVRSLVDGERTAGRHEVVWNGRDDGGTAVATGVYLVRIDDGIHNVSAKLMLAK